GHDDVDVAELVDGPGHDRLTALGRRHRRAVGDGDAAGGPDLVGHRLGRFTARSLAVHRATVLVHPHMGTARPDHEGVGPYAPAPATGHDGHPFVEAQFVHDNPLSHTDVR